MSDKIVPVARLLCFAQDMINVQLAVDIQDMPRRAMLVYMPVRTVYKICL